MSHKLYNWLNGFPRVSVCDLPNFDSVFVFEIPILASLSFNVRSAPFVVLKLLIILKYEKIRYKTWILMKIISLQKCFYSFENSNPDSVGVKPVCYLFPFAAARLPNLWSNELNSVISHVTPLSNWALFFWFCLCYVIITKFKYCRVK